MPAAVDSALDVVHWFLDRAMADREYLQPQKLHRLMYLAQAYYAVAHYGRKLMPAMFVADEMGPIEPTVFRLFADGRPTIDPRRMPENAQHFLDSIWRRFGSHSADHLTKLVNGHAPYAEAFRRGPRTEITVQAMRAFYGPVRDGQTPTVQQVMRPKVMRSHTGQPVAVTKWMPPVRPAVKK